MFFFLSVTYQNQAFLNVWQWLSVHSLNTHKQTQSPLALTSLRSITSCSMNRIRDDVLRSLTIFSIWLKYWSIRGYSRTQRRGWWRKHQFNIKDWDHVCVHGPLSITTCFSENVLIINEDRPFLLWQWCVIMQHRSYCLYPSII